VANNAKPAGAAATDGFSPPGTSPAVAIAAFGGWNDAGSAATDTVAFLANALGAEKFQLIDPEGYCDFQVNRPQVRFDVDGQRRLLWPSTDFMKAELNGQPIILIGGVEPSFRWGAYCDEILGMLAACQVERLIILGALLADVPHTRPVPVKLSSLDPATSKALNLEKSTYEGPAGIVTVLEHVAWHNLSLPGLVMWAAVPHYVASSPSPGAQLALLREVELQLGTEFDKTDLEDDAATWREGVDELASEDSEVSEYVSQLETAKDTLDSPAASGEALAKEFERYLRHRADE